jgi:GcrA cell cycle regulator
MGTVQGCGWSDDDVAKLRRSVANGDSASECAAKIAGATRSGCIGKARRLGLSFGNGIHRAKPSAPRPAVAKPAAPRADAHDSPRAKKVKSAINNASTRLQCVAGVSAAVFEHGRDECRWPIGDPLEAGFTFCGRAAIRGKPYCPDHAAEGVNSKPLNVGKTANMVDRIEARGAVYRY